MSKRNLLLSAVLLLLVLAAIIVFLRNDQSTLNRHASDISLQDTTGIDKVVITHQSDTMLLNKKGNAWVTGDNMLVRQSAIDALLTIMKNIDIQSPVTGDHRKPMVDSLIKNGNKVVFFRNKKAIKGIYVMDSLLNSKTTMMLKEGQRQPFFMYFPGQTTPLAPFFNLSPAYWRDNVILSIEPRKIKSVYLENIRNPELSFRISRNTEGNYRLFLPAENRDIESDRLAADRIDMFLSYFKNVRYEDILDTNNPATADSLRISTPAYRFEITSANADVHAFSIYPIVRENAPDPYRTLVLFNSKEEVAVARYLEIDPMLEEPSFFIRP